jgi:hypothetical protein
LSTTALIAPIIIDALAKALLYGPLWSCGLYFASWCSLVVAVSSPTGQAWIDASFSPKEKRRVLSEPPAIEAPKQLDATPSNVITFRKRRELGTAAEQPMEAAE